MTSSTPSHTDPLADLDTFSIEVPSWAYGNSGTRFKVFTTQGTPRDPWEKIADAGQVHAFTGLAPRVSIHIPWDAVDDFVELASYARDLGVSIGSVNSNLFQDDDYRLGSLTNPDPGIRAKAVAHHRQCLEVMRATGSKDLKIWLPDGTNYPGQDSLRDRQERLAESLREIYDATAEDERLLLEYKIFEPYFYSMDVPDWGTSLLHCLALGERAKVILDTGHHAPTTNIEFIVMQLLRAGRLGAFDFNSRNYGDDDLIVGSADPFQLFRIMHEIVSQQAHLPESGVNFMLDQCHNIEEKIPGQIRSVLNVQQATAKALLVDREALLAAQQAGDVLGAHGVLMDAYETDVRGLLADRREAAGLPRDPLRAFAESGYAARVAAERVGGTQAGWGA
ncbi:L-rhamnose isomerase [Nakamurella leprariae]|uniref:L-rhamnose isomerase n=1 Tax=Nakamurella leprariae TaxID=2803911 RepID=A0A939BZK8_9ACTN|nr:L-rhamnose isomerase [Nakamurella leprariae]MBM9468265.1 L-rhamnose isomerase [Nakamurella leprariae]